MSTYINTHPGELLLEDFIKPMDLSVYRVAKSCKMPIQRLHAIVHGKRSITPDTDLRLCAFFGLSPGYWLRGQMAYDLREAIHKTAKRINREVQPYQHSIAA